MERSNKIMSFSYEDDEELANSIPDCPLCGKKINITFKEYHERKERYNCPNCKKILIKGLNMKKFCVEMAVGYCASLTVEAEDKDEAIKIAQEMVLDDPTNYYDGNLEIEQINYVVEEK